MTRLMKMHSWRMPEAEFKLLVDISNKIGANNSEVLRRAIRHYAVSVGLPGPAKTPNGRDIEVLDDNPESPAQEPKPVSTAKRGRPRKALANR